MIRTRRRTRCFLQVVVRQILRVVLPISVLGLGGAAEISGQVVGEYEFLLDLGMLRKFEARLYVSEGRALFDWGSPEMPMESRDNRELRILVEAQDLTGRYNYTDSRLGFLFSTVISLEGITRIVKEPLPVIAWKFLKKRRTIGPYHCQYAEGWFRGRKYMVWYTPEIPVRFGPWKLHGLPGLVVAAHEENNVAIFRLKNLKPGEYLPEPVFPEQKPMDLSAYRIYLQQRTQNLLRKIQARMPRGAEFRLTGQKHLEIFQ